MQKQRMNRSVLAISVGLAVLGTHAYAAEAEQPAADATAAPVADKAPTADVKPAEKKDATPSMVPSGKDSASNALQQKSDDASAKTNLEEVFTKQETQYSLSKQGSYSATYDLDYTYYRDTRLDLALSDDTSTLTRLRVEERDHIAVFFLAHRKSSKSYVNSVPRHIFEHNFAYSGQFSINFKDFFLNI